MTYLVLFSLILAPAYAAHLTFFGLPSNLLMIWVGVVWAVFLAVTTYRGEWRDLLAFLAGLDRRISIPSILFLLAGLLSLVVGGMSQEKLGQFLVLFVQPMSIAVILGFEISKRPDRKHWLPVAAYLSLAAMGAFAAVQYFTLFGLPPQYQGNDIEPKRAISFFSHPNFYSLFTAPLLALLIPDVFSRLSRLKSGIRNLIFPALWLLGALGLLLSLSRAGWLGLAAAAGVYALVAADRKTRIALAGIAAVGLIAILTNTNWRFRLLLPFYGEKSAVSRLSLWHTGWTAVQESPALGLGLTGFADSWNRLNTDPNLDSHNFPHNIFLNFWVETGLLGLVSMLTLMSVGIYRGLKNRSNPILLGAALFLITLLCQGLLDNPYFKNDLALIFWMALTLLL